MNPIPAEKPSLVENLQQVSRRTRRDEVRELCRQAAAELAAAHAEVEKWKANHADMVNRNRLLRDRLDLPAGEVHPRLAILDELSRLAGELARVEKERDATRAVVAAYLEWVNSECASELDGATATHAKLVFGPSMKSYPTPTPPAKEQR